MKKIFLFLIGTVAIAAVAYFAVPTILQQYHDAQIISLDVPEYSQHPDYPTGCESIALYMLLQYYEVDITPEEIITVLPKGPVPYEQNGSWYGANPEKEFVGDPHNSSSYGVFNNPIAQTANHFKAGAVSKTGVALDDIISILDSGNPIIAWYTTNPDKEIEYRMEWSDYETGDIIQWPDGEHAVVICGHDTDNLYYCDPNTGTGCAMEQDFFAQTFYELGGRIVYYE